MTHAYTEHLQREKILERETPSSDLEKSPGIYIFKSLKIAVGQLQLPEDFKVLEMLYGLQLPEKLQCFGHICLISNKLK